MVESVQEGGIRSVPKVRDLGERGHRFQFYAMPIPHFFKLTKMRRAAKLQYVDRSGCW